MNDEQFSMIVGRYFDREAGAEEMAELQTLLRNEPEARARFWEAVEWHALFRQWGEQEWGRAAARAEGQAVPMPTAVRPATRPVPRAKVGSFDDRKILRFPFGRWAAGIAAVAAIVLLVLTLKSPAPVATLDRLADVSWKSKAYQPGARLKPGRIQLEKGAVVIAFQRGARVVVEGPADFELRSDNSMTLASGRVRARVPESAKGFEVETPQFTAVDLGTEFGCEMALTGIGELHVFTGKVDLQTAAGPNAAVHLGENQAMRVDHGVAARLSAQPLSFLSESDLAFRDLREKGDLLGAWKMASRQIDEHPATVLHLDFQGSEAVVPNRAIRAPAGSAAKGFGCKQGEGRWPGKKSLTFQSTDDRLEFALPGQFESLTLLAWVRIGNLHAGQNPLVMGRSSQLGAAHWYLYGDGRLGVGVLAELKDTPARWNTFHSEPVVDRQKTGSWTFVASVLDGVTGTATHYFNGAPVGTKDSVVRVPLQLTLADVGNHAPGSRKPGDPPPNFDGSIDELAVLATPLTPEDIARLYLQGKPVSH